MYNGIQLLALWTVESAPPAIIVIVVIDASTLRDKVHPHTTGTSTSCTSFYLMFLLIFITLILSLIKLMSRHAETVLYMYCKHVRVVSYLLFA